MRKMILNCKTNNLDEFRKIAEFSCENDITHVMISQVEKSMWQWDRDRSDPYPNWGMYNSSIFKIIVPDALKEFLPTDYAQRNLEVIEKRATILKEYGLKAVFEGMEPAWLPEKVYLKHPSWRGPRCDQPRRARRAYYAPCIDNAEILHMYEDSVYQLCCIAPIEFFRFLTNDSGGGICWSERLYPGANGPSACKSISVADRTVGFLSAIQSGAMRAGITAEAGFVRNFTLPETTSIVSKLRESQFCYDFTNKDSVKIRYVGIEESRNPTFPVVGIPLTIAMADKLLDTADDNNSNILYTISSPNDKEYMELISNSRGKIKNSTVSKYNLLLETARNLIGSQYAERLVDIWENIHRAQDRLSHLNQGGHMFMLGTVHQRWLTRPLVAFVSRLTAEEKAYYRDYQFQAETEADAENLTNLQGSMWLCGDSARRIVSKCAAHAKQAVNNALEIIDELLTAEDLVKYRADLIQLKQRLRMYICIITNACNVLHFQSIIDRTDYDNAPMDFSTVNDEQGDRRLYKIDEIVRAEIENTYEMVNIIDKADFPILLCSETEETEDIMRFGPDIKNDLLKKVSIMEKHKYEFAELYKSSNR